MNAIRRIALAVTAACLWSGPASAVSLHFSHAYGEIVDRGDLSAHIGSDDGFVVLECPTYVAFAQSGNRITLTTRQAPLNQVGTDACRFRASIVLGALPAGNYVVTAQIQLLDGTMLASSPGKLDVLPIDGRCNPEPALSPSIQGTPKGQSAADFVARYKSDPVLAAALGNPAVRLVDYQAFDDEVAFDYPPLDDIPPAMDRLAKSGVLASMWRNSWLCFSPPPPDSVSTFLEYYNAGLDHYFHTGNASEIAAIDAGKVGPGWVRTGKSFRAVTSPGCPNTAGQTVVYRFNGIPGVGPDSHFFTRDRAECSIVNKTAQWSLEGVPFVASAPNDDGSCDMLTSVYPVERRVPLYRAWRPFGDSNHRFTTERAVIAQMVAKGWVDEGVAMCVLPPL